MTDQKEYVCPMHPQIRQPNPGSCPICGMTLEHKTSSAIRNTMERSRFAKIYSIYVILALFGVYLIVAHGPHLYNFLPLLFLLCPLFHLFGHGGHGGHRDSDEK